MIVGNCIESCRDGFNSNDVTGQSNSQAAPALVPPPPSEISVSLKYTASQSAGLYGAAANIFTIIRLTNGTVGDEVKINELNCDNTRRKAKEMLK